MNYIKLVSWFFLLLFSLSAFSQSEQSKFVFGIGVPKHTAVYKAMDELYSNIFQNMGYKYESVPCQPFNCGQMLSREEIDGEPLRVAAYAKLYPELFYIDQPIVFYETVAVTSADKEINPSIQRIKTNRLKVGYQQGYRQLELWLNHHLEKTLITPVKHWRQAIAMLKQNKLDIYVANFQVEVIQMLHNLGESKIRYFPIKSIPKKPAYPILHSKHQHLASAIKKQLSLIIESGQLFNIFKKHNITQAYNL